ncbi:MAG: hypothetical protein GKR98_09740 [Boseongicola sp.]|nr:MAG: hypothetical protein GKR98_09740 [Boseongicola sp.]
MSDKDQFPPIKSGLLRIASKVVFVVLAVMIIHFAMEWATERAEIVGNEKLMWGLLATVLVAYALLIAIPFVPGIEIGISLLLLKGAEVAPMVYLATVIGLTIALIAGRFTPYAWLHRVLADLHLRRACDLVERLAPMSRTERLEHLVQRAPKWMHPLLRSGRYILLAALLNIPGNSVIGGGGGISFIAGFSRLFHTPTSVAVIALAVLPVPLAVWIGGANFLMNSVSN